MVRPVDTIRLGLENPNIDWREELDGISPPTGATDPRPWE